MNRVNASALISVLIFATVINPAAQAYLVDTAIPQAGGCPTPELWNLSLADPLNRQWSTSLPSSPATLVTSALSGSGAQLTEIEQAVSDSFGAWFGVAGTTLNAASYPGLAAPLSRVTSARLHGRPGKQRRWTQHGLLQPVERGLHRGCPRLHPRDHGERAWSNSGLGRARRIHRPDTGCRHALPQ
jgi:hypothetical protein